MKAITAALVFSLMVVLAATASAQPAAGGAGAGAPAAAGADPGAPPADGAAAAAPAPSPAPPPATAPAPAANGAAKDKADGALIKKSDTGFFGSIGAFLSDGGPMMIVILLVSLFGLALFFERAYGLYIQQKLDSSAFLDKILHHLERREFRRALDSCNLTTRHPLTNVVRAGVLRANRREKEIERAMEKEMLAALPGLQKRIGLMSLLANSSTLLGLLGTIFGLIQAFTAVGAATAAERQSALADGISQAMYTTAFGITVAVPLLFFHHFLSRRSEEITMQIEEGASSIMVALAGERQKGGGGAARGGAAGYREEEEMSPARGTTRRRR